MLSEEERLQLHQLRLLEWAEQRDEDAQRRDGERTRQAVEAEEERAEYAPGGLPAQWSLLGGLELRPWQRAASDAWFEAGRRGTIKVVTGAGKTLVALAVAERLQHQDPELRTVIVVPTIVLMEQWYEALTRQSNLSPETIGRLGGGHKDDLMGERRILITVLASARKQLPAIVRRAGVADHLLLVVDESHRAGAPEMSAVLETERAHSLGLSATPERGEGETAEDESERLWDELGGIVFEMSFADAIRDGILPPFEIHHFGLPLNPAEVQQYAALTRSLSDTRRELTSMSPRARKAGGGEGLLTWARRVASRPSGEVSTLAARYVNDTTRRKQLLYKAESRTAATLSLVREALAQREDSRVILFHESIDEVVELYELLMRGGTPAVMEHSDLSRGLRESSLELFRSGIAQVIVSARSLIEGFNVPEADLGIVVASSTSPRQRIQSIGRVLRKHRDATGEHKTSRICVLYMRDTVDEAIYEKQDWDRLIGLERNRYFNWDPPAEPVEQDASPREAIPTDEEIDIAAFAEGDLYPGRYRGAEFSTDRLGNVSDLDGRIALNPQEVPAVVEKLRGSPGRFRVTPRRNVILVRVPAAEAEERLEQLRLLADSRGEQMRLGRSEADWVTLFGGILSEPFAFPSGDGDSRELDVGALEPGDEYRGPIEPASEYRFRQRSGGLIARRVRGGEVFARGAEAERLVGLLHDLSRTGTPITRFYVNKLGHAFWRQAGAAHFIAALNGELEFPTGTRDRGRRSS
jgi:superfamily II DNA or RNA helicase